MRQLGEKTRYPGVYRVSPNAFRVRVKKIDSRTGEEKDTERLLRDVSLQEAVRRRDELVHQSRVAGAHQGRERRRYGDYAQLGLIRFRRRQMKGGYDGADGRRFEEAAAAA